MRVGVPGVNINFVRLTIQQAAHLQHGISTFSALFMPKPYRVFYFSFVYRKYGVIWFIGLVPHFERR